MIKELTTYEIAEALFSDKDGGWSRAGAFAMAEWLEQHEEDSGEQTTLDVVAIRCDFSEYESLQHWASDRWCGLAYLYLNISDDTTDEELEEMICRYIHDHGVLIAFDGGVIVSSF